MLEMEMPGGRRGFLNVVKEDIGVWQRMEANDPLGWKKQEEEEKGEDMETEEQIRD